jgi:hypothetical protein
MGVNNKKNIKKAKEGTGPLTLSRNFHEVKQLLCFNKLNLVRDSITCLTSDRNWYLTQRRTEFD